MFKKLLSIILAATVFATTLLSVVILNVNAATLAAGVYPYATNGTKAPIITSVLSGEASAYKDFVTKQTIDTLTNENFFNTLKPYNHSVANEVVSGKTLLATSLENYSSDSDKVYGTSGKSLKVTYIKNTNSNITPANLTSAQSFHYLRVNQTMPISIDYKDTASVGFWVKTEYPIYVVVRLLVNTGSSTSGFIISDRITIPAGESFVEVPLSNFKAVNDGFETIHPTYGDVRIYATDIFFKQTATFDGTRDVWFDNFGYYNYASNSTQALHSGDAIIKNSVENYVQNGTQVEKSGNIWNADSKGSIAVSNPASGTANANAYNANGQSVYYVTNSASTSAYNRFRNNGKIDTNNKDNVSTGKNAKLSVWVKTDRAIKIFITADDSTMANSGANRYRSDEHFLPAGESILTIPLTEFDTPYVMGNATCDNQFKWEYLGSLNFYFKSAVDNGNTSATVYVDSIAIIPGEVEAGPIVPDTKVTHTDGFTEIALNGSKWINKKSATSTVAVDASAAYKHSGNTNLASDTYALKVTYSDISSSENLINFYYNDYIQMNTVAPFIYEEDSVLSFWVRADQSVDIRLTYMDYDAVSGTRKQSNWKAVTVPAGESLVKIDMKDMSKDGETLDCRYAYQLQLAVRSNDESVKKSGELYFDAFGFYDSEPTNNIPEGTKPPEIPDTVITHEIGFSEVEPNAEKWATKKGDNTVITLEDSSAHYHSGKTNANANTASLKINYKNLSSTQKNVSFYNDARIQLTTTPPYTYGENSVVSFWTFTEQAVDLKISYMDYSKTTEKSVQCNEITLSIPIGESIVKIPMKDVIPNDHEMDYRYAYQLQISVLSNDDSYKSEGNIWFDAFGFYDSALVINTEPLTMPGNTYIWWNFDNGSTLEELPDNWTTRFEGEDGKGIQVALEKNGTDVYGGKGNSLKLTYNRKLGQNGIPGVWYEKRMATIGDGLIFWIKSEEKTTIRLVCSDANAVAAVVNDIPITIGYNIVQVKWSDFIFMDSSLSGKPLMNSIAQLQIRPNGASGTVWLDQIGFSNVVNDGSNAYNSIYPPTTYKEWQNGAVGSGDDFEGWPSENDLGFCTSWYFNDSGWISLQKDGNNTYLKMDYDRSNGKRSELNNVTVYNEVDPNGGISFWAKSSEERYYTLKIAIGNQLATVTFKGDTKGRTYNIPFSAFWMNNRVDKDFVPVSNAAVTVTSVIFLSDETCNPPAEGRLSEEFTLCIDDLKFVDSLSYMRATEINHTENGVTLKATVDAFKVGVIPKITKSELTDAEKQEYLKNMTDAKGVLALYDIVAADTNGKAQIPDTAVELIFDVPEGINAADVQIYQLYIDGSLSKRNTTITDDGRVSVSVFRLGEYVMAYGEKEEAAVENELVKTPVEEEKTDFPWVIVIIISAAVVAGAVFATVYFVRKGRGK